MTFRRLIVILAALTMPLLFVACSSAEPSATDDESGINYRYVIPPGAGAQIDAGEPVQFVPARLELEVGDSIEIVNRDDRGHNVGPFFVGEDETVSQTFYSPAEYVDSCTVHPSGEFTIVVS